ncbi:MAG: PQQ-binding-like beta-propeller repeat protein, partial [Cyanobacteria bacterium P01_C01_bin.89]
MTNPSLNPEKNAARNQKVLAQLANAIASSKGEFKLILAIAEGTSVCERLGLKLLERCKATQDLVIDPIELPSEISTVSENLEGAIEAWESAEEKPDALMILGIKFLENQEQFWVILNQARDRLRDVFKLPVVLWLDQASLKQMLAVANDLNSWATSKRFQTELTDHNADLELGLDELFESLNETDAEDVVLGLERVISEAEWQELMVAHAELMVAGVGIAPKLEAGVVFGRGRSGLHFDNPSSVLAHFERSRDRLQGIADAENWLGWVEWHRGVAKLLLLEERFKQSETLDLVGVLSEVKACFKTAIAFWEQDEDSLLSEIAQEWETHLLVTYRLLAARAQTSGHLEEEVQYLEYFECVSPFCFPQLALDGLRRLETVLLREKRDYLEAFKVGRHRREVERVYGVRSFIGVARLVPLRVEGKTETVPPEIEFSGRAEDLETIIDRIRGNDTKLVVLCGASGVGKSSLVNAGLLPRIPRETFEDGRVGVAIDLRQYDHWARDLRREIGERVKALGLDPCGEGVDDASAIQADLRGIAGKHREIVVVLDQFEEFFFANPDPVEQRQFFEVLGGLFGDVELGALTVVLSLRSDFLHLLLPCNQMASMGAIGGDILGRRVLYELGNLSPERAERMWQRLAPQMEEGLRRRVVDDLAAELGVVRPIELQIVGARLETLGIRDLAGYEQLEGASKDVLVQGYVDEIVEACGSGRELAQVVLFLLTDEGQGRPIKSRQELATELAQLGRETEQLGLVLEILVASDLVVTDPQLENHFRLVHDYVAELMRKTQGTKLQDELAREREARQLAQASLVELESRISIAKSELQRVDDELARAKNITRLEKDCRFSLRQFAIHEELEALLGAAHATSQLQSVVGDAPLGDYPTTEPIYATNEILRQICTQNTLKGHSNGVLSASFSPDGSTIVSASYDQTVKLWDAKTGEELRTLKGHSTLVKSANFSPDGSTIVSASYDQTVKLWDAKTGRELHTLKGHSDGVLSANFSPDGSTIVSTSHDRTVKLWNAKTGRELRTLKGHSNWVRSANFSPDGTIIVSASRDETVKLWDAKTGKELRTLKVLKRHSSGVWSANFSPDGTIIVSASDDQTVKLWDAKTGEELRTLKGHSRGVLSANFSPDGSTIVSASDDQTVKLWDAKTGEGLRTLKGHSRGVLSANFSPDGGTIVS